jgi:hypothetical protein
MGCIINHSSILPGLGAFSSTDAENSQICLAPTTHINMILADLLFIDPPLSRAMFILDSQSAIVMGISFKDNKHSANILNLFDELLDYVGPTHSF